MCGLCLVYVQLRDSSSLVIGTVRFVQCVQYNHDDKYLLYFKIISYEIDYYYLISSFSYFTNRYVCSIIRSICSFDRLISFLGDFRPLLNDQIGSIWFFHQQHQYGHQDIQSSPWLLWRVHSNISTDIKMGKLFHIIIIIISTPFGLFEFDNGCNYYVIILFTAERISVDSTMDIIIIISLTDKSSWSFGY